MTLKYNWWRRGGRTFLAEKTRRQRKGGKGNEGQGQEGRLGPGGKESSRPAEDRPSLCADSAPGGAASGRAQATLFKAPNSPMREVLSLSPLV